MKNNPMDQSIEQGTLDWRRQRLGLFTASTIGYLLQGSTKEGDFGQKAMDLIWEKVLERSVKPSIIDDDEQFALLCKRISTSNFTMNYGSDIEALAREAYIKRSKTKVEQVGFKKFNEYSGSSPDGIIRKRKLGRGILEIKCPTPKTHLFYCNNLKEPLDLLNLPKNDKLYYSQVQFNMYVWDCKWAEFVSFDYMMRPDMHRLIIPRDDKFIEKLYERVELADKLANSLIIK